MSLGLGGSGGFSRSGADRWAGAVGLGYTPAGLTVDGSGDNAAAITAALAISKVVRLPLGTIAAGDITIPSGCTLIGGGKPVYDRVGGAWVAGGTLLLGARLIVTGNTNIEISDLGVDCHARGTGFTAINGRSDATREIVVRNVATRANDHGQLWEKNVNDPTGAVINNILIEDCSHYGGPNGIAVKMRGVIIRRTVCYDVTVQAYPVVSDIINGAGQYSRAQDVYLENCDAIGCAQNLHVYSRDNLSTTNTSGVLGARNIRWRGGRLSGSTANSGAQIGDGASLPGGMTQIKNIDVWITDADIRDCAQAGIQWDAAEGGGYDRNNLDGNGTAGGSNANWGVRASGANLASGSPAVTNLTHGKANSVSATCAGHETGFNALQSQNGGATRTLTSGQRGIIQTNFGSSGALTLTLPAPKEGDEYSFEATVNLAMTVVSAAPATNRLRSDNTLYSSFATLGTPAHVGCFLTVKCVKASDGNLHWWVTTLRGTWTLTP